MSAFPYGRRTQLQAQSAPIATRKCIVRTRILELYKLKIDLMIIARMSSSPTPTLSPLLSVLCRGIRRVCVLADRVGTCWVCCCCCLQAMLLLLPASRMFRCRLEHLVPNKHAQGRRSHQTHKSHANTQHVLQLLHCYIALHMSMNPRTHIYYMCTNSLPYVNATLHASTYQFESAVGNVISAIACRVTWIR